MIIRNLQGPDIDSALTLAMRNTLLSLVDEGKLSQKDAEEFCDSHICLAVYDDKIWDKVKKWLGMDQEPNFMRPVVFKVAHKKWEPVEKGQ